MVVQLYQLILIGDRRSHRTPMYVFLSPGVADPGNNRDRGDLEADHIGKKSLTGLLHQESVFRSSIANSSLL